MKLNYDISANTVLNDPEIENKLQWMKDAGVSAIWLLGYFYGHYEASLEEMAKAKNILEEKGFEVFVISLPVGHPGNSLDPTNPDLDLKIPDSWTYRVDRFGNPVYYCGCIDDILIEDNKKAMEEYKKLGFTKVFFDDDLRQGNCYDEIQGCFCDRCIEKFNKKYNFKVDRNALSEICITDLKQSDDNIYKANIQKAWIKFNCDKVTRFMKETKIDGIQSGIMVMYRGNEKHGISLPDILKAVPDCLVRVGEWHFDDINYDTTQGRHNLKNSIESHMAAVKNKSNIYSESTVFPANALSPENFTDKIKIELSCGIKNIFLMSGTWFLEKPYWDALKKARQNGDWEID
ncbi:MAG: hypothetical protein K0S55_1145 [Clostridia bacterium]|nr:hypothetical protein [Clostridia bacterium]